MNGAVVYCPECRHEAFLEQVREVRCGLCKVRYGRSVLMLVDDRAGDLRGELERADARFLDYDPNQEA